MKIALIGGGGFRAPLVWESIALLAQDVCVEELVLHDTSGPRLARIAAVVEGLRDERGGPLPRTTTDLVDAVEGADVLFCAIRVGGLAGRVIDETIPLREGVLGQETVGPGGICFALRTLPVILDIARTVERRAPDSWFVNFTNPAGLVTEALRSVLGDRVVGICDSPTALCARVAEALGRPMRELHFDFAGLNHLGWLLGVREGDADLLPDLLADDRRLSRIEEARLFGAERLRQLGIIPNEYLVYYESPGEVVDAFRRAGATRAETLRVGEARFFTGDHLEPPDALAAWRRARDARFRTYMEEARRATGSEARAVNLRPAAGGDPGEFGYAAVAARFLQAVGTDATETLILNVANRGRLPFLDDEAVVEIPCSVTRAGADPQKVGALPPGPARLVARIKEVERTTIEAALTGSRDLALAALRAHPLVPSREVAERILAGYLGALPQLAERFR